MPGTETIVLSEDFKPSAAKKLGERRLAILTELGATNPGANSVNQYANVSEAETDWGAGSVAVKAFQAAIRARLEPTKILIVGVNTKTGSPFTETFGAASALSSGTLTAANLPLVGVGGASAVTAATIDGTAFDNIDFRSDVDPATLTPDNTGNGTIVLNPITGVFKASRATSGVGAGIVITYTSLDFTSALAVLKTEAYKYLYLAGKPFNHENGGVYDTLLTEAVAERKLVATTYDTGVAKADVEPLTEAFHTLGGERMKVTARHSVATVDAGAAFAADQTRRAPNFTTKEKVAPQGLTYTDTYLFSDFGGAENPAAGTFHEFGGNVVFRDESGIFRYSDDRSVTAHGNQMMFHSRRATIDEIEDNVDLALLSALRSESAAGQIQFNEAGRQTILGLIKGSLRRDAAKGLLDPESIIVSVPGEDSLVTADKQKRIWRGVTIEFDIDEAVHVIFANVSVNL